MNKKKDSGVLIDSSEIRKGIPPMGTHDKCPTCDSELETSYGLAGGGYGPYDYCSRCLMVVQKDSDPQYDSEPDE